MESASPDAHSSFSINWEKNLLVASVEYVSMLQVMKQFSDVDWRM